MTLPQEVIDKIEAYINTQGEEPEVRHYLRECVFESVRIALEAMQGEPEPVGYLVDGNFYYSLKQFETCSYRDNQNVSKVALYASPVPFTPPTGLPSDEEIEQWYKANISLDDEVGIPDDSIIPVVMEWLRGRKLAPVPKEREIDLQKIGKPVICLNCKKIWTHAPAKCICGHWSYGETHSSNYKRAETPTHEGSKPAVIDMQKLTEEMFKIAWDNYNNSFIESDCREISEQCAQVAMRYITNLK